MSLVFFCINYFDYYRVFTYFLTININVSYFFIYTKSTITFDQKIYFYAIFRLKNSDPNLNISIVSFRPVSVYIYGEVNNAGTIRYKAGQPATYYLNNAGGSKNSADTQNLFVIHPNGKTVQLRRNSRSILVAGRDIDIYPGSIIFVPRKSNINDPIQVASIWAPIVSSLALSLTSLSVLENN